MTVKSFRLPHISENITYILLRNILSIIFISHGVARLYHGSVGDFGGFLNSKGIPGGELIAWVITTGEIIGGIFLFIGYKVRYVVIFHFLIILCGIFLVHLENKWFVVGHGRNGVEYSLLILMVLLFIYSWETRKVVQPDIKK